jgi:hypothetical protein
VSWSNSDQEPGSNPVRRTALLMALPVLVRFATVERPDWWPLWGAIAVLAIVLVMAYLNGKAYLTRRAYRTGKAHLPGTPVPVGNVYQTAEGYFITREAYLARNAPNVPDWTGLTPVRSLAAGALLLAFLLTLPPTARHQHNTWLILLTGMLLWAGALTALRPTTDDDIGCVPFYLIGSAGGEVALLVWVGVLRDRGGLVGGGLLLVGVGLALFGLTMLLLGRTGVLREGSIVSSPGLVLFGVAALLVGTGQLLFGLHLLLNRDIVAGIAVLWLALCVLALGPAVLV